MKTVEEAQPRLGLNPVICGVALTVNVPPVRVLPSIVRTESGPLTVGAVTVPVICVSLHVAICSICAPIRT